MNTNSYFKRIYPSLPPHNTLYYIVRLFLIDNLLSSDAILLEFNGQVVTVNGLEKGRLATGSNQFCEGFTKDLKFFSIMGSLTHTDPTLEFTVTSQISQPLSSSFGVKDISFMFAHTTTPLPNGCWRYGNAMGMYVNSCTCSEGSYFDGVSCSPCDQSCNECFGGSPSECFICAPGHSFTGTSCVECDSSCDTCSGPDSNQCVTCTSGYWLQRDGTCTLSCSLTVDQVQEADDLKLCMTICGDNEFMLEDGTCAISCISPLVSYEIDGSWFCSEPCETNEFLYQDNICRNDCPKPLVPRVSQGVDLCQLPCNTHEFLYPNGTCQPTCKSPLLIKVETGVSLCVSPCDHPLDYYYETDQTCKPTCISPGVVVEEPLVKICSYTALSKDDANIVDNAKQIIDSAGKAVGIGLLVMSFATTGSAQMLTLSALVKMLEYIRYIEILYPPKLEKMLELRNDSSISFNFMSDPPDSVTSKFEENPVPGKFEKYETPSSFIINAWEGLTALGVILAVIAISQIIISVFKKKNFVFLFFKRLLHVTKWDLFLILLVSNVDGIGVYSSLMLRNINRNFSVYLLIDSVVCISMNCIILFMMAKLLYIGINIRRSRYKVFSFPTSLPSPTSIPSPTSLPSPVNESHNDNPLEKWKSWEILLVSFKDNTFLHQSFIFFFITRVFIFDMIIGYLFEYPLLQAIMITIMSFLMLTYLIVLRPYKETSHLVKLIGDETIVFIVNICVLILAVMDALGSEAYADRVRLGNAVIALNIIFNISAFVFLIFETIVRLVKVYEIFKTSKVREFSFWRRILFVFSEQEGLELEEKPLDYTLQPAKPLKKERSAKLLIDTSNSTSFHRKLVPDDDKQPDSPYYIPCKNDSPTKTSINAIADHSISIKDMNNANDSQVLISPSNDQVSFLTKKRSRFTSHTTLFIPSKLKSFMDNIDEISLDEKNNKDESPSLINIPAINRQLEHKRSTHLEHQKTALSNAINIDSVNADQRTPDSSFSGSPSDSFIETVKRKPKDSLRKTLLAHRLRRLVQEAGMLETASHSSRSENVFHESSKESSPLEQKVRPENIQVKEKDSSDEKESEREKKKEKEKEEINNKEIEEKKEKEAENEKEVELKKN